MQDPRLRHRRRTLGWTLVVLSLVPLFPLLVALAAFLGLGTRFYFDPSAHPWAAITGLLLIALALTATGTYLLRTEGRH